MDLQKRNLPKDVNNCSSMQWVCELVKLLFSQLFWRFESCKRKTNRLSPGGMRQMGLGPCLSGLGPPLIYGAIFHTLKMPFVYCSITSYHKLRGLKQQNYPLAGQKYGMEWLCSLVQGTTRQKQSQAEFWSGESGENISFPAQSCQQKSVCRAGISCFLAGFSWGPIPGLFSMSPVDTT